MKPGAKIRQKIDVGEALALLPANFLKFTASVIGNLALGGLARECRVPRSASGPVESATKWIRVRKRRIDDVRVTNTKNQFADRNSRQGPSLAQKPVVRGTFQFKQRVQIVGIIGEASQNGLVALDILGGN